MPDGLVPFDRWHKRYPKLERGDLPRPCGTSFRPLYPTSDHGRGHRWQAQFRRLVAGSPDAVLGPCPQTVAESKPGDGLAGGVGGEAGDRMPSASVILNWAPGCGRFFRTISRMSLGQLSSTPLVRSATQAPSRISPSGSMAGVLAAGGALSTAW